MKKDDYFAKQNISQCKLAELTGLSVTPMRHIETANTKLSLPALVALANTLHVTADTFLFEHIAAAKTIPYNQIAEVIKGCTPTQTKILVDIMIAANNTPDKQTKEAP